MIVYIAAVFIFAIAMFFLSIGVILTGKQIEGHCGGAAIGENCIKDARGRKIVNCGSCSCETPFD